MLFFFFFFFSSRRRHTRYWRDWSSDVCSSDLSRARDVLLRLRARILGGNYPETEPALCSVVPLGVDLALDASRRNLLEYYGYDFDNYALQALLVNSGGTVDVSTKLDRPTPYHMTLN